ncbi:MAG TPA: D-aminoacyl-tRNA deacylase [Polyangiales bacterium]|nr:D-aminoacyl-tRNA deacylase [Polyangiales bacterium]
MRAVAQRVSRAHVEVAGETVGAIEAGLLVYLGAGKNDQPSDPAWMAEKLANLRIFEDEQGKFARSVLDIGGAVLVVSQFTLYGDTRRGRRPSFDGAAAPEPAEQAYLAVCDALRALGLMVATGRFRASMQVHAVVAGPVTILLDSEKQF